MQNLCYQSIATGHGLAPLDPGLTSILNQVWFAWKVHTSNGLDDVIRIGRRCITKYLDTPCIKAYNSPWQHWKRLFVISWEYTEPRLLLRGNAWECMACRLIEICRTTASNCVEMRGASASICMEMRGTAAENAWKCEEPRPAWECELRGRLRTAARMRGTGMGSTREVRLKCVSSTGPAR